MIGDWIATRDVPTYMGFSAFTIPKGGIISVMKEDKRNKKVLIQVGPGSIDWKHCNFLQLFARLT